MYRKNLKLVGAALAASLLFAGPSLHAVAADVVGSARNVTINFVNADIVDVLKALATQTGSNIVAGPEAKDKQVTISMKNAELGTALDMVTKLNGLAYQQVSGTYVVTTPDRLKSMYPTSATTQVYTLTSMKPADAVTAVTKAVPGVMAQANGNAMVTLMGDSQDVASARLLLSQMEGSSAEKGERATVVHELHYLNPMEAMRTVASVIPDVLVTVAPGRRLPGDGKVGSSSNGTSEIALSAGAVSTQSQVSAPGATPESMQVTLNPGEEPTALLITGYPASVARAEALLDSVDIAPRQVEITARVVDLSATDALTLGLQYSFANMGISESEFDSGPAAGFATSSIGRVLSFGSFARLPFKTDIKVDALGTKGNSRILANPRIAALDSRPARIFIGDTVTAVISRTASSNGESVVTEKIHAGITLLVIPRISGDGTITLEVHPSVSALTGLDVVGGITLPRLSERAVDTTIRVKDGETVAIGGLLRDDEIKSMSRVPILGDIPIFGELFRHRNNTKTHSDITIFLTTKIVGS